jgi:chromosome segregation ATPase
LRNLLGSAGTVDDRLRASSAQIEQVLRDWLANADAVQQQSDQLRESAHMSAGVIQAIRKCHEAVDTKLKSKRWQTALKTSDLIASRLEQATGTACTAATQIQTTLKNCEQVRCTIETQIQTALENCEEVRDTVETVAEHRNEARKIASQLGRLVAEAKKAEGRLAQMTHRVGSIATGIAQKTAGLADLLGAVRELDEQQHPTGQPGNGQKPAGVISPAIWPKYRTHNAARAV